MISTNQNDFLQPIKPNQVLPGSTVGFVSPASPPYQIYNATYYQQHVIDTMASYNLSVKFGKYAFVEWEYLAGTDEERAADVMSMFTDPSISMIVANRGGYGCARMIGLLNYTIIKANPKVIMGYSDLTALLTAIHLQTGLVTFYGPMGIDTWIGNYNGIYFSEVVLNASSPTFSIQDNYNWTTITSGTATGRLIGGNLSVFVSIMDSIYFPNIQYFMNGTILFLEDVGEAPYSVDRMLRQLELAGVFNVINGFVWGRCTDCPTPPQSFSVQQLMVQYIAPYNIPSFQGAMFGHDIDDGQYTMPIGTMVEMDADKGTITMLESGVIPSSIF